VTRNSCQSIKIHKTHKLKLLKCLVCQELAKSYHSVCWNQTEKNTILVEGPPIWVHSYAKIMAVAFAVLQVPFPLRSVLWGVHPLLPPGPLPPLPRRWTLAGARGTHNQLWPHHGYHHLPPPGAGPGECVEDRAPGKRYIRSLADLSLPSVLLGRGVWYYPNSHVFLSCSWQKALATQKALLKEFFTCGSGTVCALTSLYFQERYISWHRERVETKPPPFSPHSDQIQILPVQGALEENDRCLDAPCRCGVLRWPHLVFPDLKYLNYTMALPHGSYEPGKLKKKKH